MRRPLTKADRYALRTIYIPKQARLYPTIAGLTVYTYDHVKPTTGATVYAAIAFVGTAGKPTHNHAFLTPANRDIAIAQWVASVKSRADAQATYTAARKDAPPNDRDATIASIRADLKRRSGKLWSVTGGTGTAWGWIRICAPPARRNALGVMSDEDRAELSRLLGKTVHQQGESIPASSDYRREYIARARGETPAVCGTPYWD